MPKAPLRILIVAALCVLALIGLVVRESMARDAGREAYIVMEGVDPRSLLSGHYVTLTAQRRMPGGACAETNNLKWVALSDDRPSERPSARPRPRPTPLYYYPSHAFSTNPRAFSMWRDGSSPSYVMRADAWCSQSTMSIGLTDVLPVATVGMQLRFHTNQAEAERIEQVLRAQTAGETRVVAIISLGEDGVGRLKSLMVDNQRIDLSWL